MLGQSLNGDLEHVAGILQSLCCEEESKIVEDARGRIDNLRRDLAYVESVLRYHGFWPEADTVQRTIDLMKQPHV